MQNSLVSNLPEMKTLLTETMKILHWVIVGNFHIIKDLKYNKMSIKKNDLIKAINQVKEVLINSKLLIDIFKSPFNVQKKIKKCIKISLFKQWYS